MDESLFSDQPAPKDESLFSNEPAPSALSTMAGNIIPDAKAIGAGALNTGLRTAKGIADFPEDAIHSGEQVLSGNNPMDTPLGQDAKTVGGGGWDAVKGILPQLENLGSKEQWVKHPVQNAITAGSVVAPMFAPEEEGMAVSIGKGMENKGANMAADLAETSGDTVRRTRPETLGAEDKIRMAGKTPNVADVRTQLGKKMVDEGVVGGVGQDVGDRIQAVNEKRNLAGKQVDSAVNDIKESNRSRGEYEDVDDPIHVQATPLLKPILDKANEYLNDADPDMKAAGRKWKVTYDSLADKSLDNEGSVTGQGRLNLDDMRSEMQRVGKMIDIAPEGSTRYKIASQIYGHLAQTRDAMVEQIAKQAGDPKLASNLMKANRDYSMYSNMADDLRGPASSGTSSSGASPSPQRAALRGAPIRAMAYSAVQQIKPKLAEMLVNGGPKMAKWGSMLEAAAKKGPQNLAMAEYVLKQTDPDYARATK